MILLAYVCAMQVLSKMENKVAKTLGTPATLYRRGCQTTLRCCNRKDVVVNGQREAIRDEVDWSNTSMKVEQIARKLNSKLRGWINYFGLYGKRQLHKVMFYLDGKLLKWIERKHKHGLIKSVRQLQAIRQENPAMFYHWEKGYC